MHAPAPYVTSSYRSLRRARSPLQSVPRSCPSATTTCLCASIGPGHRMQGLCIASRAPVRAFLAAASASDCRARLPLRRPLASSRLRAKRARPRPAATLSWEPIKPRGRSSLADLQVCTWLVVFLKNKKGNASVMINKGKKKISPMTI